jgi:hypothetical protein
MFDKNPVIVILVMVIQEIRGSEINGLAAGGIAEERYEKSKS